MRQRSCRFIITNIISYTCYQYLHRPKKSLKTLMTLITLITLMTLKSLKSLKKSPTRRLIQNSKSQIQNYLNVSRILST